MPWLPIPFKSTFPSVSARSVLMSLISLFKCGMPLFQCSLLCVLPYLHSNERSLKSLTFDWQLPNLWNFLYWRAKSLILDLEPKIYDYIMFTLRLLFISSICSQVPLLVLSLLEQGRQINTLFAAFLLSHSSAFHIFGSLAPNSHRFIASFFWS